MTIYDSKISLYDNLDCLEDKSREEDIDSNDLYAAKVTASELDEDLKEIEEILSSIHDKNIDNELTFDDVKEFVDYTLPNIVGNLKKLRERLY